LDAKAINPKQWFYVPLEWLQGWQFHQVYYLNYLRRIASAGGDGRRRGEFCHSNGGGMRLKPLHWSDPCEGTRHGLRRSQMYVARAFLVAQGLIRLYPTRYGTRGILNLGALEKMECLAVRADVLAQITTPGAWVSTRLQVLRAYFEAKAEKERGHTAPGGRRPCLGVREFKTALDIVPHWRYLAPCLHSPAPLESLFPPWQAAALGKVCTMADRHPPEIAPDVGKAVYNGGHRGNRESEVITQYRDLGPATRPAEGAGAATRPPKVWRMPGAVKRHIRNEWQSLCQEEGIQPQAIPGEDVALIFVAANLWHRFISGGAALGSYREALQGAVGALYYIREVAERATRSSIVNRMVDQMQRFHLGAYFEKWKVDQHLREAMEYREALAAAPPMEDISDGFDAAAWLTGEVPASRFQKQ